MRALITGMSGTGKSTVVKELCRRGYTAYDADDGGYSEPATGGAWRWRVEAVATLLATSDHGVLFFAGCSEEQTQFKWDRRVLLRAPESVIIARLRERTTNTFGKAAGEERKVLNDLREFEPLLRRSADAVIDSSQPLSLVVDELLVAVLGRPG
jgi:dephospho-CoA kinase